MQDKGSEGGQQIICSRYDGGLLTAFEESTLVFQARPSEIAIAQARCIAGPTRPHTRQADGDIGWSLVSQLSLNYLSIAGDEPARAAAALRSMLALYGPSGDTGWSKQLDGLTALQARQVVRRLPMGGPLTFGTGIEVTASLDDMAFQGGSAFLLGCLLERFFARHVALNTFSETVLRTSGRGEVMRWPARLGDQALI